MAKRKQQNIGSKLQAPKHPPNKRTIAAQELCFLSGLSGALPEAGQLAAALLFDQLQGRREGNTTLSKRESRHNIMTVSYAIHETAKHCGRLFCNCRLDANPQFQHFCNKGMISETYQSLALPKR